jgi:hypothetical protein
VLDSGISVKCDREKILLHEMFDGFRTQFTRLPLATLRSHLEANAELFFVYLALLDFRPVGLLRCVAEFLDQKQLVVSRILVLELVNRNLIFLRHGYVVVLKHCQ